VKDRVVQAAVKNIMEPIFEADFYPVSYGFRPGRSVHGCLEHLRRLLRPKDTSSGTETTRRPPYQWAIEGDIKGCFDNISHHGLMERIRRRVGDGKVNRLVSAFLKAGVLSEEQFLRTDNGTPQGGILSPLLANIALGVIEERYERYTWPRRTPTVRTDPGAILDRAQRARKNDRRRNRTVFVPIRYADDFIILVCGPFGDAQDEQARKAAELEKEALATFLKDEMGLQLSETKTLITPVTEKMRFLGHQVCVRPHPGHGRLVCTALIPKDRSQLFRERIKGLFGRETINAPLGNRLKILNRMLMGWCNFYRHTWGAKRIFAWMDMYVWWTIFRWLRKKHREASTKELVARYGRQRPGRRARRWTDGNIAVFQAARMRVRPFQLGWMRPPSFAVDIYGEPGA
jgi:group II intron reverse transcriptase/maturase